MGSPSHPAKQSWTSRGSAEARGAGFTKNTASCCFFLANAVCWCCAWHPAMPINEGGLPEHRSEHQAPRRQSPTIIPDAVAEPPSERSVFGESARLTAVPAARAERLARAERRHAGVAPRPARRRRAFVSSSWRRAVQSSRISRSSSRSISAAGITRPNSRRMRPGWGRSRLRGQHS